MRVFLVSYLYEPKISGGMGGFQKVVELARQFERRHDVTLFLPSHSRFDSDMDCVWVPVIGLPLLRPLSFNVALAWLMLARAWRERPDLVYQRVFNALTTPLLIRLLGARLVLEYNGNPLQSYENKRDLRRALVGLITGWNLRSAAKVVALTEGLRSQLERDFAVEPARIVVAPSGSNPQLFSPRDRRECRRELGIDREAPVAVFTGTFFAYQGVDLLFQAMHDVRLRELHLFLVGEGPARDDWRMMASEMGFEHVTFTGQVPHLRVALYIGAADVCLAPFDPRRGEVSPLKVMDYLFCARPTVISEIPAVANLTRQFSSLLPYTPGDAESLADALVRALEERENYAGRAVADSESARELYSWERIAREIEESSFN